MILQAEYFCEQVLGPAKVIGTAKDGHGGFPGALCRLCRGPAAHR